MSDKDDNKVVPVNLNLPAEVWGDLTNFVLRLVGPLAESAEFLTDKIRLFRFRSAIKTLKLAEQLAIERQIELNEVPLKFLVPFLEKCSLEADDSELIENWAKLLVTAVSDYNAQHPAFVDILSQIGPREAKLLKQIWKRSQASGYGNLKTLLELYARDLDAVQDYMSEVSIDEWEKRGFLVMAGSIDGFEQITDQKLTDDNIRSLLILERQNLVKIDAIHGKHSMTDTQVYVVNATITPLGFEFVSSCEDLTEL